VALVAPRTLRPVALLTRLRHKPRFEERHGDCVDDLVVNAAHRIVLSGDALYLSALGDAGVFQCDVCFGAANE
jgi:hypothetical protein